MLYSAPHGVGRRRHRLAATIAVAAVGCTLLPTAALAVPPSSTPASAQQFGTPLADGIVDLAASRSGIVYSLGVTTGNFGGTNAGNADLWISRHNASGTITWTRQLGTPAIEYVYGLAVAPAGDIYVVGASEGSLVGTNSNPGYTDGFLAKYSSSGSLRWIRQIASSNGADDDARAVAVNNRGEIYVAGTTTGDLAASNAGESDLWVARYDRNGNRQWIQQSGTNRRDTATSIAANSSGEIFVAGSTEGTLSISQPLLGGSDFFVVNYTRAGTLEWTWQWGTLQDDEFNDVVEGANGSLFAAGWTTGELNGANNSGGRDAVVVRLNQQPGPFADWTQQIGSANDDFWTRIAVQGSKVSVTGETAGGVALNSATGGDILTAQYGTTGAQRWVDQVDGGGYEGGDGIVAKRNGDLLVGGYTTGNVALTNLGQEDGFLLRYPASRNATWAAQFGSLGNDYFYGAALGARDSVWGVGSTGGEEWSPFGGGVDIALVHFSSSGDRIEAFQHGTPQTDYGLAAAPAPSGGIYVVGVTQGDFQGNNGGVSKGDSDGFLARFSSTGQLLWVRQIGSIYFDSLNAVSVSARGDVYVAGVAGGSVESNTWSGDSDVLVAKFDRNGNRKWLRQFGTAQAETVNGIGISRSGAVYVVGSTDGALDGGTLPTDGEAMVIRMDTSGTTRWAATRTSTLSE